jgi:hypothetical protein
VINSQAFDAPNTKATTSTRVDGNRPGRDFPGFNYAGIGNSVQVKLTNDKQSRSSRVRKSVAGGDAATRQKFELAYARDNAVYSGTNFGLKVFMDAHQPVTLKEGDRYPLGPPSFVASLVDRWFDCM